MTSPNHELVRDRKVFFGSAETLDPDTVNAYRWIQVTQHMLTQRIEQYKEVNNHEAAQYLQDLHQTTLDMLRAGVERHDEAFIAMLSSFEEKLSDRDPNFQRPSYGVDHALQLDEIAQSVSRAQQYYDDGA